MVKTEYKSIVTLLVFCLTIRVQPGQMRYVYVTKTCGVSGDDISNFHQRLEEIMHDCNIPFTMSSWSITRPTLDRLM